MTTRFGQTGDQLIPELAQHQRTLLLAGGVGALLSLVGYFLNSTQFFQSYLMAYMFVLGLSLGCLALTMIHQLTGGAWGIVIRQPLGAAMRLLPILTVFFIPIIIGMPHLYEWTHADVVANDPVLQHKAIYLNTTGFILRAVFYFAVWNALVYFLNKWSLEQEQTGNPHLPVKMQRLSGGGLVIHSICMTLASFDWMMSLAPHWFSTIYGMLIVAGQAVGSMAFIIALLAWLARREPMKEAVAPVHYHDLANLMLAFVIIWGYFSFSQYLLIWSGNLPEEIGWYMHRLQFGWEFLGMALVIFHFAVPFTLLLSRAIKREGSAIMKVCFAILFARLIDLFWLIAPEFHQTGLSVSWMDLVLPATLLSLWLSGVFGQMRGRPLLPIHDPQFDEILGPALTGQMAKAAH